MRPETSSPLRTVRQIDGRDGIAFAFGYPTSCERYSPGSRRGVQTTLMSIVAVMVAGLRLNGLKGSSAPSSLIVIVCP